MFNEEMIMMYLYLFACMTGVLFVLTRAIDTTKRIKNNEKEVARKMQMLEVMFMKNVQQSK